MSEIDRVVAECPGVEKVVVLHHILNDITSVIVAYFTTVNNLEGYDVVHVENDVTRRCVTSLPVFARPKLVHVGEIPLQNHTGKVDRIRLQEIYRDSLRKNVLESLDELSDNKLKVKCETLNGVNGKICLANFSQRPRSCKFNKIRKNISIPNSKQFIWRYNPTA